MKKLGILLLLFVSSLNINAQIITVPTNSDKFTEVLNSKTMVVLVGDTAFDNAVKRAVDKYWKVTKYEYINIKKVNEVISDKSKSFLLPYITLVEFVGKSVSHDKIKSWYAVILGGGENLKDYSDNDAIAISPFNYYGDEKNYKKCAYRVDYMVKGINDAFVNFKEKEITGSTTKVIFNCIKEINSQTVEAISSKTLVINKSVTCWANKKHMIAQELFKDAEYKFKYKMVSDAEFKSIMKGNDPNYLCLVPAIEVNKHILIYEPSTRKTLYYGWQMQGLKIKQKDIKSMIEGKS